MFKSIVWWTWTIGVCLILSCGGKVYVSPPVEEEEPQVDCNCTLVITCEDGKEIVEFPVCVEEESEE